MARTLALIAHDAKKQALADWWAAYKHALRSAIARWMRATREAASNGKSERIT